MINKAQAAIVSYQGTTTPVFFKNGVLVGQWCVAVGKNGCRKVSKA